MPYDRAGYLNNFGGYGNCGSAYNRINDAKLMKRELHLTETYLDTINRECANNFNNYGFGGSNSGFNDFGCGVPCGPIGGGCGPIGGGCGFDIVPPCPPTPPFPVCGGGGFGPGFSGPGCGGGFYDNDRKEKKEKKEKKHKNNDPCNPFCKPCYKPKCNDPTEEICECKNCVRSYNKIYNDED
ncbi:putative pre-mRNA-splicing factor ATP-dependent RNA helicase PRP2 [Cotonvirus japonicus]|uniref:Pre-mRNA-splicing factor ATP-dependent RNA helicase PRP2 n=1 Tax=Cotonvirus japonicus TaxID=2811091 RepID=A0ABM7NTI1_9VIRU|nr:putative pre-mRNA-splicing factor ATP-dependent RNA helicase PRP2 [Cotonvirus japonicus]BCS83474.1 putative pre-mRNA-splicing factor ATP-dependent RNA helicase PRP2 [Cotonvirus japonicus]